MQSNSYKIYIDTGGTFTDCIGFDPEGNKIYRKVLSNGTLRGEIAEWLDSRSFRIQERWELGKDVIKGFRFHLQAAARDENRVLAFDPEKKILNIEKELPAELKNKKLSFEITANEEAPVLGARLITQTGLEEKFPPLEIRLGSTRGTNALLENKGAKTALITTRGFKDLIKIGDQSRPDIFALKIDKPKPLVDKVFEVDERIAIDGNVLKPVDKSTLLTLLSSLKDEGFESIAIALLNSWINPEHEKFLKKMIIDAGFRFVSLSSELSSLIKLLERTETAVVNAYLSPVIFSYLEKISDSLGTETIKVMTSAGGLLGASGFNPKDSLLSGPAGGVVGAALTGRKSGFDRLISFDMGGTSTDVSRYDQSFDYCYELRVGHARIMSTALSIETVAAGGGSLCGFDGFKLFVGPESAGASPGPACYGAGGPLTLTDVNLLLGKLSEKNFSIPVDRSAAERKLNDLLKEISGKAKQEPSKEEILEGFISIANETMAGAIRKISLAKGYDPAGYAMVSFGGAGGLHACGIASNLKITTILIPEEAGLLSAWGIANAKMERFATRQVLRPLDDYINQIEKDLGELKKEAIKELIGEGVKEENAEIRQILFYLRFKGQDSSIEIEYEGNDMLHDRFKEMYESLYGHWVENRQTEVEAIRVVASEKKNSPGRENKKTHYYTPVPAFYTANDTPVFSRSELEPGCRIDSPALLLDDFSTFYLEKGWSYEMNTSGTGIVTRKTGTLGTNSDPKAEQVELELFAHRFMSIAENMGAMLQRTALSVNIKERLDFSCALLDPEGYLVANAPHIPVHLGGLGICVRELIKKVDFHPGDTVVTNHPGYGGSHLPDVTTVSPVFSKKRKLLAFVVNRAHHSEIGGLSPGSMPPSAKNLAEEGVVISPFKLVRRGKAEWEGMRKILTTAPYPTRNPEENLADLNASLAANMKGIEQIIKLADKFGEEKLDYYFRALRNYAAGRMKSRLNRIPYGEYFAEEFLDDKSAIRVSINHDQRRTLIDFSGSAPVSENNMNATLAIIHSVVIYVMRLLLNEPIPLNDGLLDPIEIKVPGGMLNPEFPEDMFKCPAVVGGNVEISQRLTDTLLKAFKTQAASQGTMNNVLFGNKHFGYYETLAGGTGAGNGFDGTDATHHHMTNTRITDPEIMEFRYPVRILRFEIREGSGGDGRWKGGNGLVREYEFTRPVNLSLMSQRRNSGPYGMNGGQAGMPGRQYVVKKTGEILEVKGIDNLDLETGERFAIETPGGGGYGEPINQTHLTHPGTTPLTT